MRILAKFIIILLYVLPVSSYGINSVDAVLDVDWLNLLRLGLHSVRQRNVNNRQVPLPPLGSRPMDQSHLQALPPELVGHISSYLAPEDRSNLALTSQLQRAQVQASITHLTIPVEDITSERLKDAQSKFPKVKSLRIKGSGITPENIALLAETFPKIELLSLEATGITTEGVRILSMPGMFTSLKMLNLSCNGDIKDAGIMYLSKAPFAGKLESLNLRATGITVEGVKFLSRTDVFTSLKKLNLRLTCIGDDGIRVLLQAPFAGHLELLDLTCTDITIEGVQALSQPGVFTSLKSLNLSFNYFIGDAGIRALMQAPFAGQLESLELRPHYRYAPITKEYVRQMLKTGVFKKSLKVII